MRMEDVAKTELIQPGSRADLSVSNLLVMKLRLTLLQAKC